MGIGYLLLYAALAVVALWLVAELLLQNRAPLHWRAVALGGFLGVVAGMAVRSVLVIAAGAVLFAVGQVFVTLSVKRGFRGGWSLRRSDGELPGPLAKVPLLSAATGGEDVAEPVVVQQVGEIGAVEADIADFETAAYQAVPFDPDDDSYDSVRFGGPERPAGRPAAASEPQEPAADGVYADASAFYGQQQHGQQQGYQQGAGYEQQPVGYEQQGYQQQPQPGWDGQQQWQQQPAYGYDQGYGYQQQDPYAGQTGQQQQWQQQPVGYEQQGYQQQAQPGWDGQQQWQQQQPADGVPPQPQQQPQQPGYGQQGAWQQPGTWQQQG
ncbi:hypothetical protein GCM10010495_47040 [Kitasatospora herbaricolor]|uniref:hypothetical protein n=1 Tax=Kitasatospora herbaricolor TaxID=68217 RepID=UPI00174E3EDE|nr:hypothetical protein [Kitasatospora herbaricolor]MDQ0307834.1 hypothetical protein [Kitasatospora herbaricolor]GGV25828.1 hypothetical protein GCM10010495_47040 [Kitasatospora herbaricolor]